MMLASYVGKAEIVKIHLGQKGIDVNIRNICLFSSML